MSSQIYSRYVPRRDKKESQIPPISLAQTSPENAQTKHDASSTYARYVPSKSKIKRRRIEESAEDGSSKLGLSIASLPVQDLVVDPSPLAIEAVLPANASDDVEDPRHKRLLEKREKSLKKATKLARKEAKEAAVEAGETQTFADPELAEVQELHDLVPLPQPEPVPEAPVHSTTASLPSWLTSPIRISPTSTASFSEVGIDPEVEKVLSLKGFKEAFAVQAAVLPLLLPGLAQAPGDVLVSAATGSGKTLAYVLPMIEDISQSIVTKLRGLIVMPTRELVSQAKEVCELCATAASGRKRVKIGTAVGSEPFNAEQASLMRQELRYDPVGYKQQIQRLNAKWESSDVEDNSENEFLCDNEEVSALPDHTINPVSRVDVLICTPGRLVEHLNATPGFSLNFIKWLVVDEADKLLDQSFQQWLELVMARLQFDPIVEHNNRVRKVVLSATMTRDIGQLNSLKLFRPRLVVMEGLHDRSDVQNEELSLSLPGLLVESAVKADDESSKPLYLLELLCRENMNGSRTNNDSSSADDSTSESDESSSDSDHSTNDMLSRPRSSTRSQQSNPLESPQGVLVFTKSNETAVRLGHLLALLEPQLADSIGILTSTTSTSSRRKTIQLFNAGKITILVASDLVSRGLDLPNLAHVVNYDIPASITNYVHRVGRTARAGKKGWAWTIFTPVEGRWFWNEIARSQGIDRQAGNKVSRVNIEAETFGADVRKRYETALEELGREARSSKTKPTKNRQS